MYPSDEAYTKAIKVIEFWGKGWEKRLSEPDHDYIFLLDKEEIKKYIEDDVQFHNQNHFLITYELDLHNIHGKIALNIGCGAGNESLILAYYGAHCIGMDITVQAADAANRLMKKVGTNGYGIQGDARFLPLESESIDLIYSSGVLHHSPDIRRSVEEIHRVLKPGGHTYIMLYAKWSLMFMQQRMIGVLKGYLSREQQNRYMAESGERDWQTESRKNPHTDTFTKAECAELFKNFRKVQVRKGSFSLGQLAMIGKIIPVDRLDRFSKKYLHFLGPHAGACVFIDAEK
jgi:ubiquinone/menaquinone biosynthesis C-methylase UbiE